MAVTREAYDKKVKWLKPVKCELIAYILWPDALARDRKKAVALARMAKRWGGVRHFMEEELKTLKKHRKLLKEHRTLAKIKKALNPTFLKMVGDDQIFIKASHRRKVLDSWVFLCFGDKTELDRIRKSILDGTAANKFGDPDVFFWQEKLKQ